MRLTLSLQLLNCVFEIRTDSDAIAEDLRYLLLDAEQKVPVTRRISYDVVRIGDAYRVLENGHVVAEFGEGGIVDALYPQMCVAAIRERGEPAQIHAGCARAPGGSRFLVAGAGGAGKTTLFSYMLTQGYSVESDDICLLDGTVVTPFPRRFHVKGPGLALLPEIAALAPRLPSIDSGRGFRIYSYSPRDVGRNWVIAPGPVDAVFFMVPNHGGQTAIEAASRVEMVSRLMQQGRSRNTVGKWIEDVCRLVDTSKCFVLTNGDRESALGAIQQALE